MNTNSIIQVETLVVQPETSHRVGELMTLGQNQLWNFAVLGRAPMPEEAVRLGDWLVVPAHQDTTEIPDRAMRRVQAIFNAGIRPKGFVMVHEAPMLLPATVTKSEQPQTQWKLDPQTTKKIIDTLGVGVGVLGKVAAGALTAAVSIGSMILPAFLFMGAALLDPILIAVTEDDYWIEIDRWWE